MITLPKKINIPLPALFFLIVGSIIYANTLHVPFIFDDIGNIPQSSLKLSSFSEDDILEASFGGVAPRRPVSNLSFALNIFLHEYRLPGFHIVNILIHICSAVLLFQLLQLTLSLPTNSEKYSQYTTLPFIAALLWLTHPLATQSVTYIVQRMTSLATMFYLLALLFYVKGRILQQETNSPHSTRWVYLSLFIVSFISGLLALGSKEIAATLPVTIFLYEWYFFKELQPGWIKKKIPWILTGILVLLFWIFFFLGKNPIENILHSCDDRPFTSLERLLTELRVIVRYISLTLYPHPDRLILDYNFPLSTSLTSPISTLSSLIFLMTLFITALVFCRKERFLSFCLLWFFLHLLIESSVICVEIIYEHRTYLPSAFFLPGIIALFFRITRSNKITATALLCIAVLLSFWTIERNKTWHDSLTLWSDNVKKAPGKLRSLNNLGKAYYENSKIDLAIETYQKVLEIDPTHLLALRTVCKAYRENGHNKKAMNYCKTALSYYPKDPVTLNNLALLLSAENNFTEAEQYFRKALQANANSLIVNLNLGSMLLRNDKPKEAIEFLEKASLAISQTKDLSLYIYLGEAYFRTEKLTQALEMFKNAVEIAPDSARAHYNLALVHSARGNEKDALFHYQETINLVPFLIPALYNFGNLLLQAGEMNKAAEQYRGVIAMRPEISNAYNNLGLILVQNNQLVEAQFFFQEALQVMPTNILAQENLQRVQRDLSSNQNMDSDK